MKLKKPRKVKQKTISQLRKEADKLFSTMVRYRDGRLIKGVWHSQCITCGQWKFTGIMHAGHFQSRRHASTRWDEENVNAQCAGCNLFGSGEQYKYSLAVDLKYGEGTAQKLHKQAGETFKTTRPFLEDLIRDCKAQIKFYERA